jgi:hypothetical protein
MVKRELGRDELFNGAFKKNWRIEIKFGLGGDPRAGVNIGSRYEFEFLHSLKHQKTGILRRNRAGQQAIFLSRKIF